MSNILLTYQTTSTSQFSSSFVPLKQRHDASSFRSSEASWHHLKSVNSDQFTVLGNLVLEIAESNNADKANNEQNAAQYSAVTTYN